MFTNSVLFTVSILFFGLIPKGADAACICLKCAFGQHEMYQAVSESMAPTIDTGECAIARYIDPAEHPPVPGDVVVFAHPVNGLDWIFRVVALAGDTVQMVDGVLVLNGDPVITEQLPDYEKIYQPEGPEGTIPRCQPPVELGGVCITERFRETLPNGRSYETLNIGSQFLDNTDLFAVPDGYVFVLGDHRDNAVDSRMPQRMTGMGFLPVTNISGLFEGL